MTSRDWESLQNATTVPWASFSHEEFIDFYWRVVAPILEEEGHDPETVTSAEVLREFGFGKYIQAIRRHYDYSYKEFLLEEAGVTEEASPHEFNWPSDDARTKEKLDEFVRDLRLRDSTKQAESTIQRVAMNNYSFLHEWRAAHGSDDIIDTLENADEDEAYSLVLAVYDRLHERVPSENTKSRYQKDQSMWFEFLCHPDQPLDYNPIPDVAKRFRWKRTHTDALDRPALSSEQVRKLWRNTETLEEKMIVIAACAWGLRSGEISSLHISQIIVKTDAEDDFPGPVVNFETRKAGPSAVNVIYGMDILQERVAELQEEYGDDWNGYLFPSDDRRAEHLGSKAILKDRFQPLCRRAGIVIEGDVPNLKHARRYWYQEYVGGINHYQELLTAVADQQGSKDPVVVLRNYIGKLGLLQFSRTWMQIQLDSAFADTELSKEALNVDKTFLRTLMDLIEDYLTDDPPWIDDEKGRMSTGGVGVATALLFIVTSVPLLLLGVI